MVTLLIPIYYCRYYSINLHDCSLATYWLALVLGLWLGFVAIARGQPEPEYQLYK